ncbi:hypothetical protein RI367_008190 [Sorochytrium milnesiophthora]
MPATAANNNNNDDDNDGNALRAAAFVRDKRVLYDLRCVQECRAQPDVDAVDSLTAQALATASPDAQNDNAVLAAAAMEVAARGSRPPATAALSPKLMDAYAATLSRWKCCQHAPTRRIVLLRDSALELYMDSDPPSAFQDTSSASADELPCLRSIDVKHDPYPAWRHVVCSPDGAAIAVAYSSGQVTIYAASTGKVIASSPVKKHAGFNPLARLVFVPDTSDKLAARRQADGVQYAYELLTFGFRGNVASHLFDVHTESPTTLKLSHRAFFGKHHPTLCDAALLNSSRLLLLAGAEPARPPTAEYEPHVSSVSLWELLPSKPWYRTVDAQHQDSDDAHASQATLADDVPPTWINTIASTVLCRRRRDKQSIANIAFRAAVSPDQRHVAVVDLAGNLSVLDVSTPTVELTERYTEGALRAIVHERVRGTPPSTPRKKRRSLAGNGGEEDDEEEEQPPPKARQRRPSFITDEDVDTDRLVSVAWWSDSSLILSMLSGATTICNLPSMDQLLPNEIEYFNSNATVLPPVVSDFLILDCQLQLVRVRAKDRNVPLVARQGLLAPAPPLLHRAYNMAARSMRYITDTLLWHFETDAASKHVFITVPQRCYRFIQFRHASPQEVLLRKLSDFEYAEALRVCTEYGLDADIVYQTQWLRLPPDAIDKRTIDKLLGHIKDKVWVARTCAECIPATPDVERQLLIYGLKQTEAIRERALAVTADTTLDDDFDTIARLRLQLFRYLDRLELAERISRLENSSATMASLLAASASDSPTPAVRKLQERPATPVSPASAAFPVTPPTTTTTLIPTAPAEPAFAQFFAAMRNTNIVKLAMQCAASQSFQALHLLFQTHAHVLKSFQTLILDHVPETVDPMQYYTLLPSPHPDTEQEKVSTKPLKNWRSPDWIETPVILTKVQWSDDRDEFAAEVAYAAPSISDWFASRARAIELRAGRADLALKLVSYARRANVPDLDDLFIQLHVLNDIVYHCVPDSLEAAQLSLADLAEKSPAELVRLYFSEFDSLAAARGHEQTEDEETLDAAEGERIVDTCRRYVIPLLRMLTHNNRPQQLASKYHVPDAYQLLCDVLVDLSMSHIEWCTAVIEASSPTLAHDERIIPDDVLLAQTILRVTYACPQANVWTYLDRMYACCPDFDDEDETDDPQLAALAKQVADLDDYLTTGELLFKYSIEYTVARVRDAAQNDAAAQMQCLQQLVSGGRVTPLPAPYRFPDDAAWMVFVEDVLSLHENAFLSLLPKDAIVSALFTLLLQNGVLDAAKQVYRQYNDLVTPHEWENLALQASRELIRSCESGSKSHLLIQQAMACLRIPPTSERLQRELDFIAAIDKLVGVGVCLSHDNVVLPSQVQQFEDKLQLVSLYIHYSGDYSTKSVVALGRGLGLTSRVQILQIHNLVCVYAVQHAKFDAAVKVCEDMMALLESSKTPPSDQAEIVAQACLRVANSSAFTDHARRKSLLAFVLRHSPAASMASVLDQWKSLDLTSQLPYVDLSSLHAVNSTFHEYLELHTGLLSSPQDNSDYDQPHFDAFYAGDMATVMDAYGLGQSSSQSSKAQRTEHILWTLLRASNALSSSDVKQSKRHHHHVSLGAESQDWVHDATLRLGLLLSSPYRTASPTTLDQEAHYHTTCIRFFAGLCLAKLYDADAPFDLPRLQTLSAAELMSLAQTVLEQPDLTDQIEAIKHAELRTELHSLVSVLRSAGGDVMRKQREKLLQDYAKFHRFDVDQFGDSAEYRLETVSRPLVLFNEAAMRAATRLARQVQITTDQMVQQALLTFVSGYDSAKDASRLSAVVAALTKHMVATDANCEVIESLLAEMAVADVRLQRAMYQVLSALTPASSNSAKATELDRRVALLSSMRDAGIDAFDLHAFLVDNTVLWTALQQTWPPRITVRNANALCTVADTLTALRPLLRGEPRDPTKLDKTSADIRSVVYSHAARNVLNDAHTKPMVKLAQIVDFIDDVKAEELKDVYTLVMQQQEILALPVASIERLLLSISERVTQLLEEDAGHTELYRQLQRSVDRSLFVYAFLTELENRSVLSVLSTEQQTRIRQGAVTNPDSLLHFVQDWVVQGFCKVQWAAALVDSWNAAIGSHEANANQDVPRSPKVLQTVSAHQLILDLFSAQLSDHTARARRSSTSQAGHQRRRSSSPTRRQETRQQALARLCQFVFEEPEDTDDRLRADVAAMLNDYVKAHEVSDGADRPITALLRKVIFCMWKRAAAAKELIAQTWPSRETDTGVPLSAELAADLFVESAEDTQRRVAVQLLEQALQAQNEATESSAASVARIATWMVEQQRPIWMLSTLLALPEQHRQMDSQTVQELIAKMQEQAHASWGEQLLLCVISQSEEMRDRILSTANVDNDLFAVVACISGLLPQLTDHAQLLARSLPRALLRLVDYARSRSPDVQRLGEQLVGHVLKQLVQSQDHALAMWTFLELQQTHPLARSAQMQQCARSDNVMMQWLAQLETRRQAEYTTAAQEQDAGVVDDTDDMSDMRILMAWFRQQTVVAAERNVAQSQFVATGRGLGQ